MLGSVSSLARALAYAKGLTGVGKVANVAKGGASTLGAFHKGASAKRLAGEKLAQILNKSKSASQGFTPTQLENIKYVKDNYGIDLGGTAAEMLGKTSIKDKLKGAANLIIGEELMSKPGELAFRLAPDAAFGLMGAAMTPGDLGDKAIAGTTQFLGGGLTGIAAGRGARALGMSQRAADMADMVGSVGGDFLGMAVGDQIMRVKGGGMTPMEQQMLEQDALYRAQLEQEFLQKYGIGGTVDPVMAANGLVA